MTVQIIKAQDLKGLLYGEFANQVEQITKEEVIEIIHRVSGIWEELWEETEEKSEKALWDNYHETYHSNEGNILFDCVIKEPEEGGFHVVSTTCRVYPIIQEGTLSFQLAVAFYGESQDQDGEHIAVVDTGTHETFKIDEIEQMIERFLKETKYV